MVNPITNLPENARLNTLCIMTIDDLRDIMRECFVMAQMADEQNKEEKDSLLSENQVIEMLSVSRPTLWRWTKNNYLPKIKIGSKNMYKSSDVQKIAGTANRCFMEK